MALVIADRVKETTTTTGTGTVTLLGASTGFQSFAVIGDANTTYYAIVAQTGTEWEVGIGTYTSSGTTLARTTILSSSNSGSAVNFSAGTKDVFVTYPSGKSVNLDASGNATALGTPVSGTVTNLTGTASININGTVGATTAAAGAFTTLSASAYIRGTSTPITGATGGTITPTSGTTNQYNITALGAAATLAIPSGTPIDGQKLIIRIEDNGTARALTWTTSAGGYRVIGTTLPTTTVISKTVYVGCIYNSTDLFWDVVAVAQQA